MKPVVSQVIGILWSSYEVVTWEIHRNLITVSLQPDQDLSLGLTHTNACLKQHRNHQFLTYFWDISFYPLALKQNKWHYCIWQAVHSSKVILTSCKKDISKRTSYPFFTCVALKYNIADSQKVIECALLVYLIASFYKPVTTCVTHPILLYFSRIAGEELALKTHSGSNETCTDLGVISF